MINKFIQWIKSVNPFAKKKTLAELKKEIVPEISLDDLPEYKKPIEGVNPTQLQKARDYSHKQKQRYFMEMKRYGKSSITDRQIRKEIKKRYGITIEETNSQNVGINP